MPPRARRRLVSRLFPASRRHLVLHASPAPCPRKERRRRQYTARLAPQRCWLAAAGTHRSSARHRPCGPRARIDMERKALNQKATDRRTQAARQTHAHHDHHDHHHTHTHPDTHRGQIALCSNACKALPCLATSLPGQTNRRRKRTREQSARWTWPHEPTARWKRRSGLHAPRAPRARWGNNTGWGAYSGVSTVFLGQGFLRLSSLDASHAFWRGGAVQYY